MTFRKARLTKIRYNATPYENNSLWSTANHRHLFLEFCNCAEQDTRPQINISIKV
jgi:hypothetical protein